MPPLFFSDDPAILDLISLSALVTVFTRTNREGHIRDTKSNKNLTEVTFLPYSVQNEKINVLAIHTL